MSNNFVLEPLVVGRFPAFPIAKFLYQSASDDSVEAPCISWLARSTTSNRIVLVDTGPAKPTEETSKFHVGLDVRDKHRIDKVLTNHGIDPAEITDVVFTHLHFDHCSYAEYLENATIHVQKEELRYAIAPNQEHRTGYETGYKNVIPSWMKSFDKVNAITGDVEIVPGLVVLSLPGHTPGSAGAIFDTALGRHAVVGDLVNQIENWEGTGNGHIAPTLHFDIDACHQSFSRLEKEADVVLASHDKRMLDQDKYGIA